MDTNGTRIRFVPIRVHSWTFGLRYFFSSPRSGLRGASTRARELAGPQGVEPPRQSAARAGSGVFMDGVFGRHLVQPLRELAQLAFGLGSVATGQCRQEQLTLVLDVRLAGAIAGA